MRVMEIFVEPANDVTVLRLQGELDSTTAPKVTAFINDQVAKGKIKLVADFKDVPYSSSAGLRMLLAAVKGTRSRNGDIRLAAVQPDVLRVLTISGFTSILKIYADAASALDSFSE